ncbi:hypothetical protein DPMN_070439 [Dreissena polymorpha]|uniref:Uncharacterized protein n=1 Tax=Dreissena polymorpha TaxID=45954 RepID=A0A9D4BNX3_DREPO|nr:hypothetical protein DPMN_070439 [Dreissena polymorpha]
MVIDDPGLTFVPGLPRTHTEKQGINSSVPGQCTAFPDTIRQPNGLCRMLQLFRTVTDKHGSFELPLHCRIGLPKAQGGSMTNTDRHGATRWLHGSHAGS